MYKSVDEFALRKSLFEQNLLKIDELNEEFKGETTFKVNKFIDLTPEEWQKIFGRKSSKGKAKFEEPIEESWNLVVEEEGPFNWADADP